MYEYYDEITYPEQNIYLMIDFTLFENCNTRIFCKIKNALFRQNSIPIILY